MTEAVLAAKRRLVEAGLVLDAEGLGDLTRGHVSVRDPSDPGRLLMKPHGIGFEEMTVGTVLTCTLDGEKVDGEGKRHSEVFIHSEILKARPHLNAVVHAHPRHATAFSLLGKPWDIASQSCASFPEGVALFDQTIGLVTSPELGRAVSDALGGLRAVILRGHGVAVAGETLEEAVVLSVTLETACRDLVLAHLTGATLDFDAAEVAAVGRSLNRGERHIDNFDYLLRRARRAQRL